MKTLLIAATVIAVGCSGKPTGWANEGARPSLIVMAEGLCTPNNGVKMIWNPRFGKEHVACGEDCWKQDGWWVRAMVACNNGAEFRVSYVEKGEL